MPTAQRFRRGRFAGAALILIALAGCSSSSTPGAPTSVARFAAGETAAGQAMNGALAAIRSVYTTAAPPAGAAEGVSGLTARSVGGPVTMATAPASCEATAIKFYNAQGQEQPAYAPLTTTRATAKGACTTSGVATTVDLVLDDLQASSSSLLVNGTTQSTYGGYTAYGTITNLRMAKQTCAYPTSGEVSMRVDQTTMAVRFDGSASATVTYTFAGVSVTFSMTLSFC